MRPTPISLAAAVIVLAALATPATAADVAITEANQKFDRDTVTLKAGDALVVSNADAGDHNLKLVDDDGDPQDVGLQKPGKVIRLNFPNAGSYRLRCTISPDMRVRVVVN